MKLHVFKMEVENVTVRPPKRKKVRRLRKRKICTLFSVDQTSENERPLKQRRMKTAAPENTTQFIMADKPTTEPLYVIPSPPVSPASHCTSSPASVRGTPVSERDFAFDSGEEALVRDFQELDFDLDFFHKDFEETYNRIQEEQLLSLSKNELVCKYRELEGKEEILQKQCQKQWGDYPCKENDSSSRTKSHLSSKEGLPTTLYREETRHETCLHLQLEDLRRVNKSLVEENMRLKALKCSSVGLSRLA